MEFQFILELKGSESLNLSEPPLLLQLSNSVIGYLNNFYLEERNNDVRRSIIGKEAAVTCVSQNEGIFGHFCGLNNILIFVCAQT